MFGFIRSLRPAAYGNTILEMGEALRTAKKILFIIYLACLHIVAAYFICAWLLAKYVYPPDLKTTVVSAPAKTDEMQPKTAESPTAIPIPSISNSSNTDLANSNQAAAAPSPSKGDLIIPVVGVKPEQLSDTFSDARSEGRIHDAIDIAAPAGTPVIAAADGEIIKFFDSHLGGTTIYQLTADRKFVLYYAHLQSRARRRRRKTRTDDRFCRRYWKRRSRQLPSAFFHRSSNRPKTILGRYVHQPVHDTSQSDVFAVKLIFGMTIANIFLNVRLRYEYNTIDTEK